MPDDVKKADSSTADDEGKVAEEQIPDDEETVEKDAPWHKDPRFRDFIGKKKVLKQYEALGTPETIVGYVQQLEARLAELEEAREPGEQKTKEQLDYEASVKKARKQLREIDPDIEEISSLRSQQDAYYHSLEVRAGDETVKQMRERGMEVTPTNVKRMANLIAAVIEADDVATAEFMGDPRGAVKAAFEQLGSVGKSAEADRSKKAAIQKEKEKQAKLPRTHESSGVSATGGEKPIRGLKDADARAREYLKGVE